MKSTIESATKEIIEAIIEGSKQSDSYFDEKSTFSSKIEDG